MAVVAAISTTPAITCVAMVVFVQNQKGHCVVEQSTTIPRIKSAVGTTCCRYRKVLPAADSRITTQQRQDVVLDPRMVDITLFKNPRAVADKKIPMNTINGHKSTDTDNFLILIYRGLLNINIIDLRFIVS